MCACIMANESTAGADASVKAHRHEATRSSYVANSRLCDGKGSTLLVAKNLDVEVHTK